MGLAAGPAKTLAGAVDHLLSLHAFDAPILRGGEGCRRAFVGRPALAARLLRAPIRRRFRAQHRRARRDEPILLVLPGSRPARDRSRRCRSSRDAVRRLKAERPDAARGDAGGAHRGAR